jgi:formate dehydrogenase major subunit
MKILVNSKKAIESRKKAVSRILNYHKLYCSVCENNNGDCPLHEAVIRLNINSQNYIEKPYPIDDSGPFYVYDPSQCILCGRCVEACQDFAVNEVIWINWDLNPPRVVWDSTGNKIGSSSCVNCGTCVTVCPVNALMEKSILGEAGFFTWIRKDIKKKMIESLGKAEDDFSLLMAFSEIESKARETQIKRTKTVCPYCGVGCSFEVWTKGRKILKVEPKPESPVNGILTCVKGKFGLDFVNSNERLTKPLIREGDRFREASWEEAIEYIARKLKEIKEKYGPDSIGFIASDKMSNEEAYLLQKLARAVIGTNNVDNSARYCQSPATVGLWRTVGIGADSGTIKDIADYSDLIIIVGHNTTESHPVVGSKIKRAQKIRGAKVVVIDVRKHEMAERADLFIRPKPGTDAAVLAGVANYIISQGWEDKEFIKERVKGFEEFKESIKGFTLDYVESISGVPREQIIKLAEMIHEAKRVSILWGMGVTQHLGGADTSTIISDLLLITGNYGKPGSGAFPMRGHNNVQGVSDFGCLPNYLPGYQKLDEISKFEEAWKTKLNPSPGLQIPQMIEGVLEGKIHALYILGEDTVMVDCGTPLTKEALEKVDFLVVQDMFMTETAKFADVILPAASSLEKDGTFVNTERRIQRFYKALEPIGESKPDWEIIQMVANALGANWNYKHPSEIMDEVAKLCPIFAGVSYSRLEGFKSLVWPVSEDGKDTPLLYVNSFATPDGKAVLYPLSWKPPALKDEVHKITVNTGRVLEHFHVGNMTRRVEGLRKRVPETFVEISKELAEKYSIKNGDLILVKSKFGGEIKAKALISERVSGEEIFIPLYASDPSKGVNNLTGMIIDKASGTPGYKDTPVMIEKLEEGNSSTPLPSDNWRFHINERKKQIGIEVEKKWKREEFKPLTS